MYVLEAQTNHLFPGTQYQISAKSLIQKKRLFAQIVEAEKESGKKG